MKDNLRYNIIIDNRSIVSSICINELEYLLTKVELVLDRLMLESIICNVSRQIGSNIPMLLIRLCNILTDCKYCNSCSTCKLF